VARPKTPLITRAEVVPIALRIIDEEGLTALSLRRLATELNVNNKSLYHHFADKNDIVTSAAELALSGIGVPSDDGEDWAQWLLRSAHIYRDSLLAHPELITVMLARGRFGFGLAWFDQILGNLERLGVPVSATIALIEALDSFAIGNALCKTAAATGAPKASEVESAYPNLARGLANRTLRYDEQFRLGCWHLIEGISLAFGLDPVGLTPTSLGRR
jgi:AcrR family transcriptional regulator